MLTFILLSLLFGASGHDLVLIDGPCPNPKPLSNFDPQSKVGVWHVLYNEAYKDDQRCDEETMVYVPNEKTYNIDICYKEGSSEKLQQVKAVEGNDTAIVYAYVKMPNGNWTTNPWIATMIGLIGDQHNATALLEFGCQVDEMQHYEYYQIIHRNYVMTEEDFQSFIKITQQNGRKAKFIKEKC